METPAFNPVAVDELFPARRSLRMAIVTETYPPEVNGVAMTIGRMVAAMQQRQHHIQLVRPRQGREDQGAEAPGLEQILKPGIPIPNYDHLRMGLPVKYSLMRLWKEKRPDIVHLVTEGPLGWSALSAALKLKLPVTSDFHTNFHSYSKHYGLGWLKTPISSYLRKFHNRTQLTLVPTQDMRSALEADGYRNLRVVARGVDTQLFNPARRSQALRQAWGLGSDDLAALYVGRLAPEKNLPLVLRAFHALRQRHPSARLVMVGDGPMRGELERDAPGAIFAGMRTGVDLATHYASADLFLFPSMTETYGNVTLEAMASGLAVLAYDYAAARELIRHGDNGLLVPFGDVEAFASAPREIIRAEQLRRIGRHAQSSASRQDWETIHDEFEGTLAQIVTTHERSSHVAGIQLGSRPA